MEKEWPEGQERKARSDKGIIMATRRDQYCIAWIAEQYAARGDQVRRLLSRFPDPKRPFKEKLIGETTTKDQIGRWKKAGWIEYRRILADEPGWVWVTKKGLQLVDLEIYTAREPAATRLGHIYAVNQVRLFMDEKYAWYSERRYRANELAREKARKGVTMGPIPDGIVTTKRGMVAIEVELSAKKLDELTTKLIRLVRFRVPQFGFADGFPAIWFYVSEEKQKRLVEEAMKALTEAEQKSVSVAVTPNLLASKHGQ